MPSYDYRCRTCDDLFEMGRPISDSNAHAARPAGHAGIVRLLSTFTPAGVVSPSAAGQPNTGGCCGGGCGCTL